MQEACRDRKKFITLLRYVPNTPQGFIKYFKECRKMSNIIEILEKEIGVKDNIEEIIKACDEIQNRKTTIVFPGTE